MLEMVGLAAGQHHPRQQKFRRKKNQRCEDWNGPEEQEQKESLGAEEDSARVGDGDVQ